MLQHLMLTLYPVPKLSYVTVQTTASKRSEATTRLLESIEVEKRSVQ